MEAQLNTESVSKSLRLINDAYEYAIDATQRSLIFADILRKRGNNYMDFIKEGQPPVLVFDYEMIMNGKELERPVNHDLVRILPPKGIRTNYKKRPIVVVDPRAGHGPGIGGSKRDSEIGVALKEGHPVYFILFHPEPIPGQTYDDVQNAQALFCEKVKQLHPESREPALIGNCQAGWAVALMSANRPDVTGPLVLNGSPLSYWAGESGKNPMRYRGGLLGGTWLTSLLCDLGNGQFDGANLVMNFEDLNPANTYWTKQYNVWADVDKQEDRYLNFEKWWNSYFMMNAEEIHFIVKNLFVGNRLECGQVELDKDKKVDLKNIKDPVMVFASSGDNITPPQQALNWIAKVYGSVDEIRRLQQVIIYRVHEKVGHLGIFVSSKVAKKEHQEIIHNIDYLEFLPPGLYEMVIDETYEVVKDGDTEIKLPTFNVRYEERDISDIYSPEDSTESEREFKPVAVISELNDRMYQKYVSPWVRWFSNSYSAEMIRQIHPMRMSRYVFSDNNPFLYPVKQAAEIARRERKPASEENIFVKAQECYSNSIIAMLDGFREMRDATHEYMFKSIYGNRLVRAYFNEEFEEDYFPAAKVCPVPVQDATPQPTIQSQVREDTVQWMNAARQGGMAEGLIRIMLAIADANHIFDERQFEKAKEIIRTSSAFKDISPEQLKQMAREQSRILQTDQERAIRKLRKLIKTPAEREEALIIAEKIATADLMLVDEEQEMLEKIQMVLEEED